MGKQTPFNGCKTLPNPCYNPKTKTDCLDRSAGCYASCEKWREHKENRQKVYEVRGMRADKTLAYNTARKTRGRDKYYGGGH